MPFSKALVWGTLAAFLFISPPAFSAIVESVDSQNGNITLQDGGKVVLAGIDLDEQGISVLKVLAEKQDIRIQELSRTNAGEKPVVLAFINTKSLKFPPAAKELADEREVMLNEFLIRIGAAKVDEKQDFDQKSDFLKWQEEAKRKGEGVWSYEKP